MKKQTEKLIENGESPLYKHTPKSFAKAVLLGVIIGFAVIIPGISGSTLTIIFGMYSVILYAMGNVLKDFKRCIGFLLPLGIGEVVGFFSGFFIIQKFFGGYMFLLVCLFAGLMIGAVPAIIKEIKGEKITGRRAFLLALGGIIPLAIGALSIAISNGEAAAADTTFTGFPSYLFILYIPLGLVVSITQIIPGLSATALLMALGQFRPLLNSLHVDYVLQNPEVIGLYVCFAGGFLTGIVLISKAFSRLIKKYRAGTFSFVVGLSLGSIAAMFLNPDVWNVYKNWQTDGRMAFDLTVGIPLLLIGIAVSFWLVRYENKHKEE